MSPLPSSEETERACEWVRNIENINLILRNAVSTLSLQEYTTTLRSFLMRLLKQPSYRVQPHLYKDVPMSQDGGTLTLEFLLNELPREKLLLAFQLIYEEGLEWIHATEYPT